MTAPHDDVPPEVEALRRVDETLPAPSAEIEHEIFSRVQRTLNVQFPATAPAPIDGHARAAGLLSRPALRGLTTFLVGAAVGAGVHAGFDRHRANRAAHVQTVAEEARAVPLVAPVVLSPEATAPRTVSPPTAVPVVVSQPEQSRPRRTAERDGDAREHDRDLGAERSLIEQARTALARGQAPAALAALDRHAVAFPRGTLVEERESLRVQALVGSAQYDQARQAGIRFHRRFPQSIFGAVVDDVLRSIP